MIGAQTALKRYSINITKADRNVCFFVKVCLKIKKMGRGIVDSVSI